LNKKDSAKLQTAFDLACKNLETFLKNGISDRESLEARVAAQTINSFVRLRTVEAHESAIGFGVARAMANNTAELKQYVQRSLPEFVDKLKS